MSGINNTWVRHCHVIENCTTTDHKISLDFSSLRRQKNRPFQLRFEDADWQNFMSHLEYIYILNQDLTKFYKDPPPVGDFSIAPQLKLRRADRQRGHIVMVKTYIFHRRFSNISHHTKYTLNNFYNYYFVCVVQGGRRPSALYWPAATALHICFLPGTDFGGCHYFCHFIHLGFLLWDSEVEAVHLCTLINHLPSVISPIRLSFIFLIVYSRIVQQFLYISAKHDSFHWLRMIMLRGRELIITLRLL